jgi:serine/threonine protein kinase
MLFYQLLDRIEAMHEKNYIHRDIKPDNIMMGMGDQSNIVHMIDFGLTRPIIDPKTG